MVDQAGKTVLSLLVEGIKATCDMSYLVSKVVKRWTSDNLTVDAQTCADDEASLVPSGWRTGVVSAGETVASQVH